MTAVVFAVVVQCSERIVHTHKAVTVDDLERLTRDLPARTTSWAPPRARTRWSVAVMGDVERRSRWRIEGSTVAVAVMGGIDILVPEGSTWR